MIRILVPFLLLVALATPALADEDAKGWYPWLEQEDALQQLATRIPPPEGCVRREVAEGSFAEWLRYLPLLPGRPDVMLHDGSPKGNQSAHEAVVDIDVGTQDLQQCADAVIRLRAEYLHARGRLDEIHFNFTSGDEASYTRYRDGWRASVQGNRVSWNQTAAVDASRPTFRRYLNLVFMYAGTHSLSQELDPVEDVGDLAAGDVFIQGGFPGHAVIVADVAEDPATDRVMFLLLQSYMPAQQIHLLRALSAGSNPWYPAGFGETLKTPEWVFQANDLKRFREPGAGP